MSTSCTDYPGKIRHYTEPTLYQLDSIIRTFDFRLISSVMSSVAVLANKVQKSDILWENLGLQIKLREWIISPNKAQLIQPLSERVFVWPTFHDSQGEMVCLFVVLARQLQDIRQSCLRRNSRNLFPNADDNQVIRKHYFYGKAFMCTIVLLQLHARCYTQNPWVRVCMHCFKISKDDCLKTLIKTSIFRTRECPLCALRIRHNKTTMDLPQTLMSSVEFCLE